MDHLAFDTAWPCGLRDLLIALEVGLGSGSSSGVAPSVAHGRWNVPSGSLAGSLARHVSHGRKRLPRTWQFDVTPEAVTANELIDNQKHRQDDAEPAEKR